MASKNNIFKTNSIFPIDEVLAVQKKIEDAYSVTKGFKAPATNFLELSRKALPEIANFNGINLSKIRLTGRLPLDEPWPFFEAVIKNAKNRTNLISMLRLSCGFEEKSSRQAETGYDVVSVFYLKGRQYFGYAANGSIIATDKEYRRQFFNVLINTLKLPIKILDQGAKSELVHSGGGEVKILDSSPGQLPNGFSFELPGVTDHSLLEILKKALSLFSKNVFACDWNITLNPGGDKNFVLSEFSDEFPADNYDINLEFSVIDIRGLDHLRVWFGDDYVIESRICNFDMPGKIKGELYAETSKIGHKLILNLSSADGLEKIEQGLGIKFSAA